MFKHLFISVCLLFSVAITAPSFSQSKDLHDKGVIQIKFKKEHDNQLKNTYDGKQFGIAEVDHAVKEVNGNSVRRIFRESGKFEKAHRHFGLHLWYEIQFDKNVPVSKAIEQFKKLAHFEVVAPRYKYELIVPEKTEPKITTSGIGSTNDPYYNSQWHYENTGQTGGAPGADISLPQAWGTQTGKPEVIVAVIDGGIDVNHPDLSAAMWVNANEIPNNGIDDDQNGYVDDIYGYGFGDNTGTIHPHYHGVHVGGTIGAVTNNGIGVSGIAGGSGSGDGVRLMSLAGFGQFGVGGFEEAMIYAADNGAVISQNSWSGGSTAIEAAIDYFVARAGFDNTNENFDKNIQIGPMAGGIVIFAAGNSNSTFGYPSSYPPVMAVAATDHNDHRASFSTYGNWVDIAAPGVNVYSTFTDNSYAWLSGTSMACPHVSGVAALIISQFGGPAFYPNQVWDRLQATADDIDNINPGYEGLLGTGRLNAHKALEANDDIPPATVSDLTVKQPKLRSIVLSWTAPGASEMEGAATYYDLRYSLEPIDAANFENATQVVSTPKPKVAGTIEEFEVKNLAHTTTYYFALKAKDFFGNISAISNVISGATPPPPVIEVTPSSIEENLLSGELSTKYLKIKNTGESDLIFSASTTRFNQSASDMGRSKSGLLKIKDNGLLQPIKTQANPYTDKLVNLKNQNLPNRINTGVGLTSQFSSSRVFALNYNDGTFVEIDAATGNIIKSIPSPEGFSGGPDGLAFDGEHLYFVNAFGSGLIHKIKVESGELVGSLSLNGVADVDGLAHSGEFLYLLRYGTGQILEIDYDKAEIVRTITPGIGIIGGLSFGGSRGTLFVTNFGLAIYELDLTTGEVINTITPVDGTIYGLGYSEAAGAVLAANVSYGRIDAYDPETGQFIQSFGSIYTAGLAADEAGTNNWLKTSEEEVIVAAGEAFDLPVTIDASGLNGGTYQGAVLVKSNDPVTPVVTIPVTLQVTGAPNIRLSATSIDFGDVFEGGEKVITLIITNSGSDVLSISSVVLDHPNFIVSNAPFQVDPGKKYGLPIKFVSGSLGNYHQVLVINSNDPNDSQIAVSLDAHVVEAPEMEVTPTSLTENLYTGQTSNRILTIKNKGEAELTFNVSIGASNQTNRGRANISLKTKSVDQELLLKKKAEQAESYKNKLPEHKVTANQLPQPALSQQGNTVQSAGRLFSLNYLNNNIVELDPANGSIINSVPSPVTFSDGADGLAFDGKYLYYMSTFYADSIHKISPETGEVVASLYVGQEFYIAGLGHSGKHLYAADYWLEIIYEINFDSGEIERIIDPDLGFITGLSYGGRRGTLFVSDFYNYIYEIDLDGNVINSIAAPSHYTIGLGYSEGLGVIFASSYYTNVVNVYNPDTGQLLYSLTTYTTALASDEAGNYWLSYTNNVSALAPGASVEIPVYFDATGLFGGTYTDGLRITSNDPLAQEVIIPITLSVTGAPNILLSTDSIDFGDVYLAQLSEKVLVVKNSGTDLLMVSSITSENPKFGVSASAFQIEPGQQKQLAVSFSSSQIGEYQSYLAITSNSPMGPVYVVLRGRTVAAPQIVVAQTSLNATLALETQQNKNLTLSNTGGSDLSWSLSIDNNGQTGIESVLENLNKNSSSVVNSIPNRYDFYEGTTGYYIDDGGYDMYDGGNLLSTNLGGYLYYSDKVISTSAYLGDNKKYFTAKYNGLFVLVADVDISSFTISGDLGADGDGQADGATLNITKGGKSFKGFVKRVYNAGDPSVNHLIIVENLGSVNHSFSTYTNDDQHTVFNLSSVKRIYYLLYAGNNGQYINNTQTLGIMDSFLTAIEEGTSWLSIQGTTGVLPAGQSETLTATFNTAGLGLGTYQTTVKIDNNDPAKPQVSIPVTLTVKVVANNAPIVSMAIADRELDVHSITPTINLAAHFTDEDNDALKYTATTDNNSVASVSVLGSVLSITPVNVGETSITVWAEDVWGDNVADEFKVTVTVITDINEEVISKVNAYPNPFSKSTTVAYNLHREANVKLLVYDAMGRALSPPLNELQLPGKHEIEFDGRLVNNGIYYFKLLVNDRVLYETKMMKN
jgi:subtilisin family serine protease